MRLNLPGPGPLVRLVPKAETAVAAEPVESFIAADLSTAAAWWFDELADDVTEEFHAELVTTVLDVVAIITAGPPASDEVQAAQDYNEDYYHDDETEDAWAVAVLGFPDQVLDVVPQLFPPAVAEPIETFVAQPTFSEHDFETLVPDEIEDYLAPPEQLEFLAPPEVPSAELLAAQPYFEDFTSLVPDETDDYANDISLDRTASFAATPIETFASQVAPDHDFGTLVQEETEDYQPGPEQLEFLAPPEVPSSELLAAQPHFGEAAILAEESEDYANDVALDVTATFFPLAVEPVETFASQPLSEQAWFADTEVEDYQAPAEQLEFLAPPEAPSTELVASQPHFGEYLWPAEESEDYANESGLDLTPFLFPTALEPIETFAAQPLTEQAWFPDTELEDYQALPEQAEFLAPPEAPTTELTAAQPHYGEAFWPEAETEDYQQDSTVDPTATLFPVALEPVETFGAQPLAEQWFFAAEEIEDYLASPEQLEFLAPSEVGVSELVAAQPHFGEAFWPEEETEDYTPASSIELFPPVAAPELVVISYTTFENLVEHLDRPETSIEDYGASSLDIVPQLFPPLIPPGAGRPVADPRAADLTLAGATVGIPTQGMAVLDANPGTAISSPIQGQAVLDDDSGDAILRPVDG